MPLTTRDAAPAHSSVHDAAPRQSTLQLPVHATTHSAFIPHVTLLLAPTVTLHVESGAQLTFELAIVRAVQWLPIGHSTLHDSSQV